MKYVRRIDIGCHGYEVMLPKIVLSRKHTKLFADSAYGNKKCAYLEAKKYVKKTLIENGCSHLLAKQSHDSVPIGKDGVVGVTRRKETNSNKSPYWRASYTGKTGRRYRRFSVNIHGECGAFRSACKARYEAVGVLYIRSGVDIPCMPEVPYRTIDE